MRPSSERALARQSSGQQATFSREAESRLTPDIVSYLIYVLDRYKGGIAVSFGIPALT